VPSDSEPADSGAPPPSPYPPASGRRFDASSLLPAVIGLVGVLLGGLITFTIQDRQLDRTSHTATNVARREAFAKYLSEYQVVFSSVLFLQTGSGGGGAPAAADQARVHQFVEDQSALQEAASIVDLLTSDRAIGRKVEDATDVAMSNLIIWAGKVMVTSGPGSTESEKAMKDAIASRLELIAAMRDDLH